MTIAHVERAAKEQNGWQAIGIVVVDLPAPGTVEHGVIAFQHGDLFGTAQFGIENAHANFFWGHYDLTRTQALEDLTKRLEALV